MRAEEEKNIQKLTLYLSAGLVQNIMGYTDGPAVRIYQMTYIVGFFFSIILYFTVSKIWPPAGLGIAEEFQEAEILDARSSTADEESGHDVAVTEKEKAGGVVVTPVA
jgi:hypothetical protein